MKQSKQLKAHVLERIGWDGTAAEVYKDGAEGTTKAPLSQALESADEGVRREARNALNVYTDKAMESLRSNKLVCSWRLTQSFG